MNARPARRNYTRAALELWLDRLSVAWEHRFAREEVAQHVGDGDAAPEGSDLDPAAQLGRHVDGQPGGETAGVTIAGRRVGSPDPLVGIGRPGGEAFAGGTLAHGAALPSNRSTDAIRARAFSAMSGLILQPR